MTSGMRFVNHWHGLGPRIEATRVVPRQGPKARITKKKPVRENGWHDLPEDWTYALPTISESEGIKSQAGYLQKFDG